MSSTDREYDIQCHQLTENMIFSKSLTLPYYLFDCEIDSVIDWPSIWPIPYTNPTITYLATSTARQIMSSTDQKYKRTPISDPTILPPSITPYRLWGIPCDQLTEDMTHPLSFILLYHHHLPRHFDCETDSVIAWSRIWPIPIPYSTLLPPSITPLRL